MMLYSPTNRDGLSFSRVLPKRVTEPEDKRSRSFMTASGMKTFRVLQPTVNNSALAKVEFDETVVILSTNMLTFEVLQLKNSTRTLPFTKVSTVDQEGCRFAVRHFANLGDLPVKQSNLSTTFLI